MPLPIPVPELMLMLLIGIIFGGVAAVVLRGSTGVFVINILLGVIGASIGTLLPVIIGSSTEVSVQTFDYLLRALMGAFLLVVIASLFRSARPRTT